MLTKYLKQAPTMIVIGVTGFAAWPILFPRGKAVPAAGTSRPPESSRPPDSITALGRNPFKTDQAPGEPEAAGATASATASAAALKADGPPDLQAADEGAIAGLRLIGTFVDGREQLALIDGKIYARGDSLRAADGSPMPYIVAEVRKDRAVLRRGRRDFLLGFSDKPRPALAKAEGPKAPGKAEAPAKVVETAARAATPPRAKAPAPARPGDEPGDPRRMIMQLLSGIGGPPAGGPASGVAISPSMIAAGLDAMMGKFDGIGREGVPSLPTAGAEGAMP